MGLKDLKVAAQLAEGDHLTVSSHGHETGEVRPTLLQDAGMMRDSGTMKSDGKTKKDGPGSRARAHSTGDALAKTVRKAVNLAEVISDEHVEAASKAILEATRASGRMWDSDAKAIVETPDHRTRLAAGTLILAYRLGTPLQRQSVEIGGQTEEETQAAVDRALQSPALLRHIERLKRVTGQVIDVSESGGEKPPIATEKTAFKNSRSETEQLRNVSGDGGSLPA
jgi:hypothetical protein